MMRGQSLQNICFQHFQGGLQFAGSTEPCGFQQSVVTSYNSGSWTARPSSAHLELRGSPQISVLYNLGFSSKYMPPYSYLENLVCSCISVIAVGH